MNVKGFAERTLWRVLQWHVFSRVRPRLVHTDSFLLKGKTKNGLGLSVIVFSNYENIVHYLSKFAFSNEQQITRLGRVTYHNMFSVITEHKPDLVLGQFAGVLSKFLSKSFLVLPSVNFSLDISRPTEEIVANMMYLRRRSIRKIEDSQYVYEVTKNPKEFEDFYRDIYLPFSAKTARGSFSRLIPFDTVEKWFLSGELLLVKSAGGCFAGLLYHPEPGGIIHCRLIAYTEGLAAQAAFYHLIRTAKDAGYKKIDYGVAPPLMSDGLFFYKKSLGMEIDPIMDSVLAIQICNFGKPVQDFLISNPFVFTDFKSMIGMAALSTSVDKVNLSSFCHKHYVQGLHKLILLYPKEYKKRLEALASQDIPDMKLSPINTLMQLTSAANYEMGILKFPST